MTKTSRFQHPASEYSLTVVLLLINSLSVSAQLNYEPLQHQLHCAIECQGYTTEDYSTYVHVTANGRQLLLPHLLDCC